MKNLTKVFLTALGIVILVSAYSTCYAQQAQSVDDRINELDKTLNLTDKQKEQIRELFETQMQNQRQRPDSGRQRPGWFGMRSGFRSRTDSAVEDILTEEQVTQYRTYRRNRNIDMRITSLDDALELNDDQKAKIRTIIEEESKKSEKIFEDMPESREDRREYFQKFRELREETNEALEEVFTKKQSKQYNDMLEEMQSRMRRNR